MQVTLNVATPSQNCFVEITRRVQEILAEGGIDEGVVVVFVPHTTAGITINENADPNVVRDFLADLDRLIPYQQPYYRHMEGNSAAHLKASLMGSSVSVIVEKGRLSLGTWQGIYLCEFDGPRNRRVLVKLLSGAK
jgi:secondary thiamine-phosphate synthase enzyme